MFSDPFYAGVYRHGSRIANLNEQYNFMPLMTPDEYITINRKTAEQFAKEYVGHANAAVRLDVGISYAAKLFATSATALWSSSAR